MRCGNSNTNTISGDHDATGLGTPKWPTNLLAAAAAAASSSSPASSGGSASGPLGDHLPPQLKQGQTGSSNSNGFCGGSTPPPLLHKSSGGSAGESSGESSGAPLGVEGGASNSSNSAAVTPPPLHPPPVTSASSAAAAAAYHHHLTSVGAGHIHPSSGKSCQQIVVYLQQRVAASKTRKLYPKCRSQLNIASVNASCQSS